MPCAASLAEPVGEGQHLLDVAVHERPIGLQRVEGAGGGQRLQRALVERLGVEPPGEVGEVLERAVGGALGDDGLDRLRADVLQRRQRVADGAGAVRSAPARKSTSEALTQGGRMAMPDFLASAANMASLSVLPQSSVIDAARNSSR